MIWCIGSIIKMMAWFYIKFEQVFDYWKAWDNVLKPIVIRCEKTLSYKYETRVIRSCIEIRLKNIRIIRLDHPIEVWKSCINKRTNLFVI